MVFTFTPANALLTLLGVLLRISDIKLLYFGAVGLNFAMIGIAAAYVTRELSGSNGAHVALAAVAMPLSAYMETMPFDYQFSLTFLFMILFLVRFLKTRRGVYLFAAALALVANSTARARVPSLSNSMWQCFLRSWRGCAIVAYWRWNGGASCAACSRHRPWRWQR